MRAPFIAVVALRLVIDPAVAGDVHLSKIEVVDTQGKGLEADVNFITSGGSSTSLGTTEGDGTLSLDPAVLCTRGAKVSINVEAGPYTPQTIRCEQAKDPLKAQLTSYNVLAALKSSFDSELAEGHEARAALIANDIGARITSVGTQAQLSDVLDHARASKNETAAAVIQRELDAQSSQSFGGKINSWTSTGAVLFFKSQGIDDPVHFDPAQKAIVMTPEARSKLSDFQKAHNLQQQNGTLDYQTYSAAAGVHIDTYLKSSKF
jgi:hypothetical protein